MIHTINCNNWPYSFQEKCKIVHSRQRAVGHLSYSGTLKFWKWRNTLLYKHMTVWLMVVWWYCVLPELKLCVLCNVVFFHFCYNQLLSPRACLLYVLEIALIRIFFFLSSISDTHLSLYYSFCTGLFILWYKSTSIKVQANQWLCIENMTG